MMGCSEAGEEKVEKWTECGEGREFGIICCYHGCTSRGRGGRAGERPKRTANAESRSEAAAKWKRPARELAQGNGRGTWSEGVWRPGKMGGTKEAEAVQQ